MRNSGVEVEIGRASAVASTFMNEDPRMLPVSMITDCSVSPHSCVSPMVRLSTMSVNTRADSSGKMNSRWPCTVLCTGSKVATL